LSITKGTKAKEATLILEKVLEHFPSCELLLTLLRTNENEAIRNLAAIYLRKQVEIAFVF
jgi:hypothetical protein